MKSIEYALENELGDSVILSGVLTDTTVTLKFEKPDGIVTNTLTHEEGRTLTSILLNLFPEMLPQDDDEEEG